MTYVVDANDLASFGELVLAAAGVPDDDARLLADSLATAELWGHPSHGMLRLPWYVDRLRSGAMHAVTNCETVIDAGATAVLDGHDGIGQVLINRAVRLGVERAKKHGISAIGVRNSNHFGTAAYFTRESAKAGCVAFLASNSSPAMAPWGGRTKCIGTNPWSIAAPAGERGIVVMDIANTAVARGKIYLADERGLDIPATWAADADGKPTTSAKAAIEGLMLPMAGHKGYVIAFMMDVLAGVLTGSNFGAQVAGPHEANRKSRCGHLLITIDIQSMMPLEEFNVRLDALITEVKSVPTAEGITEIYYPGELEQRNSRRNREGGIFLAGKTWEAICKLSAETGTALPSAIKR